MNRGWAAALALGAVILAIIWWPDAADKGSTLSTTTTPAEISPLSIQWHSGVSQQYKIVSESSMQMESVLTGGSTIRVHMQCQLNTLTLKVSADEALVGMQMSSVELKINDNMDANTNRELSLPFRVRFASNGLPLAFDFPAEVSTRNRSIVENLVRMFQVSLESGKSWIAQEANGSGSYEASYTRTGPTQFEKSKHNFIAISSSMMAWTEASSKEQFSLKPGYDWITKMNVEETMRSDGQGGPAMTVSNHATLELQSDVQLALNQDIFRFNSATAAVDDMATAKLKRPIPDMTTEEARKQVLSTIPDLDTTKRGRLALVHRLRDLIRVDASLPAVILEALKTQELSDRTRADLYLVLEIAGTNSAQEALVAVITDSSWSVEDGMRAIVAMSGLKTPTAESISVLWDTAQNGTSGDERQRMVGAATFALGSLGHSMNKSSDPEYSSLRSSLLDNALSAGEVNQRANFITALGNTQDTTLANELVILLDDAEPSVRRATALSLGSLGTDQVADQLVSHYSQEDNGYVRGAIAESLQSWTQPTDSAMAMFRQKVSTEVDERTRYNIALLLGNNLAHFPENETVLKEIMRIEPSKRIRQKVAEALAMQKLQQ